jgi:chorismate dehydratase
MEKIRISAVRYANTYPFIFGLAESKLSSRTIIETDHPAECALKLISGKSDLGLIPVAAIPQIRDPYIVSNYCIGADGNVRTVQLMGNSSLEETETIYLDYRSATSVKLVKVLANRFWKREFKWKNTSEGFDFILERRNEAVVLIGDQCFEFENRYTYNLDLAGEWKKHTGLPFVFACWVANKVLNEDFLIEFNSALAFGVNNIDLVAERFGMGAPVLQDELKKYLTENISFGLDQPKREAMALFLDLQREL